MIKIRTFIKEIGKPKKELKLDTKEGDNSFFIARVKACAHLYKSVEVIEISEDEYVCICKG